MDLVGLSRADEFPLATYTLTEEIVSSVMVDFIGLLVISSGSASGSIEM
jgi:hypothetical protein